jgi:hypothetical protein
MLRKAPPPCTCGRGGGRSAPVSLPLTAPSELFAARAVAKWFRRVTYLLVPAVGIAASALLYTQFEHDRQNDAYTLVFSGITAVHTLLVILQAFFESSAAGGEHQSTVRSAREQPCHRPARANLSAQAEALSNRAKRRFVSLARAPCPRVQEARGHARPRRRLPCCRSRCVCSRWASTWCGSPPCTPRASTRASVRPAPARPSARPAARDSPHGGRRRRQLGLLCVQPGCSRSRRPYQRHKRSAGTHHAAATAAAAAAATARARGPACLTTDCSQHVHSPKTGYYVSKVQPPRCLRGCVVPLADTDAQEEGDGQAAKAAGGSAARMVRPVACTNQPISRLRQAPEGASASSVSPDARRKAGKPINVKTRQRPASASSK